MGRSAQSFSDSPEVEFFPQVIAALFGIELDDQLLFDGGRRDSSLVGNALTTPLKAGSVDIEPLWNPSSGDGFQRVVDGLDRSAFFLDLYDHPGFGPERGYVHFSPINFNMSVIYQLPGFGPG